MADRPVRAAIAGCGENGIGRGTRAGADLWFTHAGVYSRHPRVELVAAADPSADRRELCRRVWNVDRLYPTVDALLAAERIGVLSVCTPDETHASVALTAIAAGVPAVFCEKPIASTAADAEHMVTAARQRGAVLAVNHHRRWEAGHREVRAMIARGDLGRPLAVTVLFAGGFRRVGTHAVDLLRYFFGDGAVVSAATFPDESVQARLRFNGGVGATVTAWPKSGSGAYDLFEIDIVATRGRVRVADFGAQIHHWPVMPSDEYGGDLELARQASVVPSDMRSAFVNGVDAVLAAREGAPLASTGEDALEAVRLLEAIEEAALATPAATGRIRA